MVQKSFGLTFTNVSEALEALVSYLNGAWRAARREGRFVCDGRIGGSTSVGTIKKGLRINNSYLVQYLLTVDLKLETCY